MLTESGTAFPLSAAAWKLVEAAVANADRLFYAARLAAALLVATLVPILIDRRLRR